ncbi:hypothetical protein AC579_227 [Pseudocercospora musae]|uniref:Uncharacterized protein n=1 Tax=Pseudocercospora musae TaxID=113226 RepID=A0A139I9G6_9PEZI|nr:hypothetical protein AC579_227 [Pseudocercospora musae]
MALVRQGRQERYRIRPLKIYSKEDHLHIAAALLMKQSSIRFHDLVAALEILTARFETSILSADDCHGSHLQQTSGS